jgi:hypothetical protein
MKLVLSVVARKQQFGIQFAVETEESRVMERRAAFAVALVQAAIATAVTLQSLQAANHIVWLHYLLGR